MTMTRTPITWLALLLVLMMLATACAVDDAEDDTAGDTATDEAAAEEPTPPEEPEAEDDGEATGDPETEEEAATEEPAEPSGDAVAIEGVDGDFDSIFLPKFTGNVVFDQANEGAVEAAEELGTAPAEFVGPTADDSVAGQIEIVTNAVTQGVDAIMISNNAGDQLQPAVDAAAEAGLTVTTWDSPLPSGQNEDLFIAQVDFDETGQVLAEMALEILGEEGGQMAVLSASPDAVNQNAWLAAMDEALADPAYDAIELVDTVYGNDESEESYNQTLGLIDSNPDLDLIMSPTSVGIVSAARAVQTEGLCDDIAVSGLGLPEEMLQYHEAGCAPQFALWDFVDLGYLTFYATYGIATGQIEAAEGTTFTAGRMGEYTIEADPTREEGLRIVMGPFSVYDESNL